MSAAMIRKVTENDLPVVERILLDSRLGNEGLREHFSNFLVAEVDGKIVGSIGLELYNRTGLLRSAAVLPSFQGRGIGEQLVAAIEQFARDCEVSELVLLTTTAAEYFERKGFVRIQRETISGEVLRSEQFGGACPSTAIVMRMEL
ncbi:MAG: GNAT family N-acetyltransferase [Ignavibacteriae bacterium]|nr:GNAT family N-acetyltransferase [Ignavibacteria bacterium]MBI3364003.1 GNAT family N-acetyltransferase [Ignavibacteriota bacterium]